MLAASTTWRTLPASSEFFHLAKYNMPNRVQKFVESMSSWGDRSSADEEVVMAQIVESPTDELLDPKVLSSIGGMDFVSRMVVDGTMSGIHRSSHKGGCSEFEDHRPYVNGDELRHIDWRLMARRDRYYVKQFRDETNLQGWLVVDTSGSMKFGQSTVSKYDFARTAAACLARLLLKQRDSVGLSMQGKGRSIFLPAQPRSSHFQSLLQRLVQTQPAGAVGVEASLDTLSHRIKRRGIVLVFSDCFCDIDPLVKRLKHLRSRGNDVIVFQVVAPEEVTFDLRGDGEFIDLERTVPPLEVDFARIRKAYQASFGRHQQQLGDELRMAGCDHVVMTTDQPLEDVLSTYLLKRQAMSKK
jgi:uncharacterized protein (DUF58 family)